MTTRILGGRIVTLPATTGPDVRASVLATENLGIARINEPVTMGIPIPRGTFTDVSQLSLRGPANEAVPLQSTVLNRWSDGSVKWALLDFPVHLAGGDTAAYELRFNCPSIAPDFPRVTLREEVDQFVVDTGPAEFRVDKRWFRPFHSVTLNGRTMLGHFLILSPREIRHLMLEPTSRTEIDDRLDCQGSGDLTVVRNSSKVSGTEP